MKLPLLRWPPGLAPASAGSPDEPAKPSLPAAWLLLHALFCATSMAVGFRFSRLIVYLLFLPTPLTNPTAHLISLVSPPVMLAGANATATTITTPPPPQPPHHHTTVAEVAAAHHAHVHHGPVFVGRHPIRVRPWPHPDPTELLKAHRILAAVQDAPAPREPPPQRRCRPRRSSRGPSSPSPRPPPPRSRCPPSPPSPTRSASSTPSSSGSSSSRATAPTQSPPCSRTLQPRLPPHHRARREIRKKQMDGIVVFADENSILRTELFDEAQKVAAVGAAPVGILGEDDGASESFLQAPACDGEGERVVGYHVSEDTVLPANRSDMLLSSRLEWAGFVFNARALWDGQHRPEWVRDLDAVDDDAASPLALVADAGRVEPLAKCAHTALAWSLRSDTLHEVKFPHQWKIDPPLLNTGARQEAFKPETPLKETSQANTEEQH
ncbi:hypothetical protein PR202_ga18790 [Eleusine coracana subsp. coracana]|uniref:Glycosyltransferases n=1 Tax=Eleusine coracana subsp. coracana TaxID=191504 RepID=A0AAV5CSP5_ELECO|nr:hypothetical protein PR202_ga18790 [Eleusine coracana subsp. coracana]